MKYLFTKIFIASTILLLNCTTPKNLVYKDFKDLSVEKMGFASSAVTMSLIYYNPNNFKLQLKSTELDIYLNGNFVGHSSQKEKIVIPKRADFDLPIKIDVDMKNIFKNAFTSAFNDEVTVKAMGKVSVGKAKIFISFPVNYEGKHKFSIF